MAEDTKLTYHFEWDPVKARSNLAEHTQSDQSSGSDYPDYLCAVSNPAGDRELSGQAPLGELR